MKAAEAKPAFRSFRIIPQHTRTSPHVVRPSREAVPSTQSRLHGLCLCLLHGMAPPDWTAPSGLPDCTLLSAKIHTAAKQSVPLLRHAAWGGQTSTGLSQGSPADHDPASSAVRLSPETHRSQFCPGLCRHLAPRLSYTWRGCAEDSLPAPKGLLSFA